jgi:predicted TPR repeat methyltransferase
MTQPGDRVRTAQEHFERAIAYHQQGLVEDARREYLLVLEVLPEHADALHLLGVSCYQAGDSESAERYIRSAILQRPEDRDFHSNLGLVLNARGKHREAIDACGAALALDPGFTDCLNNLANAYLACGMDEDATQVLRDLLERDPDHVEACNNLAVIVGRYSASDEARRLYEHAIRLRPDYADALANLGRMLARGGEPDAAIEYLQRAVELDRENTGLLQALADVLLQAGCENDAEAVCIRALAISESDASNHVALGNVYQGRGLLDRAEACYRHALGLDSRNARAVSNLGAIFMRNGDVEAALNSFNDALEIDPEYPEAMFNKGTALQKLGRLAEAAGHFSTALAHNPRIPHAYRYLAEIYRVSEMRDSQIEVLQEWLRHFPASPTARHLLHAAEQRETPSRASDEFVREEFDGFADGFEETLAGLDYRTPELIGDLLSRRFGSGARSLRVLDAGCGTGLCAPFLKPYSTYLAGVDLSPKMIGKAAERHLYDDLQVAELTGFMIASAGRFDLVVSADTLVYFGALDDVFAAAGASLGAEGRFVFSVECLAGEAAEGYRLNPSGRYAHGKEYVRQRLAEAGFLVEEKVHAALRTEMQKPVDGLIVLARRQPDAGLRQ